MNVDDSTILKALRDPAHVDEGFRMLMEQYGEQLYWHVRRIVVGHEDAEDTLQESVLQIYQGIARFKGDEQQLKPWIYRIATNEALQLLRSRTRLFQSIDDLTPQLQEKLQAESDTDMRMAEYLLQDALLTLPTQQRLVFNMHYFDDMPYEQIALVTGKKVGTLKVNYHYAKMKVEVYLKNRTL